QDEIAKAIVGALRGALKVSGNDVPAVEVKADTDNLPAYETYLKARELFIARRDLKEGVRLFERVVELDPKFARGWEGLAGIYSVAESWGIRDRDYTELARTAARRALELDAKLSMPWAALGMAEMNNPPIDWEKGLENLNRAIAADPNNATAWLFRSIAWLNLGFFERAHADQDRCLAIDPAYRNCMRWKAVTHLHAGQIEKALALYERGVAEGFVRNRAADFVPFLHARGDRIGARLLLQEMGADTATQTVIMARLDDPQAPIADVDDLVRRFFMEGDSQWVASVDDATGYLYFGAFDRVADAKRLAFDTGVTWNALPSGWRNSPGFKKLVTRLGLVDYWRKHGYPPQCRPVGKNDFECDPVPADR
ncbi:MAG: tetratricopeptide repeat protein, partial [Lysobacterales bacterium]